MLAFGSPMLHHAIVPPLITISGFAPKKDGFQTTRSASLSTCTTLISQNHNHINKIKIIEMLKLKPSKLRSMKLIDEVVSSDR